MRIPTWLTDSIARRFALTQMLTVGATLVLVFLFNDLAGVWGREPFSGSGLLTEIVDNVRISEAAPPGLRRSLAAAASTETDRKYWFPATSEAARFFLSDQGRSENATRIITRATHRMAVGLKPEPRQSRPPELRLDPQGLPEYLLGVRLQDGSWAVFATSHRSWGLDKTLQWCIRLLCLAVSIAVVTVVAARQFARPIKKLAAAVGEFGINHRAPPIPESGPWELRQVIRTFNEMQAQIQKFVAYRTMMLAAISHDLRTPLTRVRLRGELIEDSEQQARLFRDVDEMQTMIDGALAFFRDDAITEPTTSFDLPNVLLTIANDYADQSIDIRYQGPAHAVYQGRPFALKRALNNLVENAIKYATPPDIELVREPRAWVVVVRDRGPGIPEGALGNVFLPYYRVNKSRNRNTGGVGLGLTVAQAIVHGHGGEITLRNCPEGGLQARVMLPLASEIPSLAVA
jgi:signal transduction histidine kinase